MMKVFELAVVLSIISLQSALSLEPTSVVPIVVLRDADSACPFTEVLEEARQNLSNLALQKIQQLEAVLQSQCGPGQWKQVVSLNMSNSTHQCPSAWTEYSSPIRSCGRGQHDNASCEYTSFSTGIKYSKVCGRARGMQSGSSDAFDPYYGLRNEEYYVDGISVTYSSPQQHIWTFAADSTDDVRCSCNINSSISSDAFVGNKYFCDSQANGVLWDGEDCAESLSCCTFNSPPWFSVQLPAPTTDNINVGLCASEGTDNENIFINVFELYVQ